MRPVFVVAFVAAAASAAAQPGRARTADPVAPLGTVTGVVSLDGTPLRVLHAVAVRRPPSFEGPKEGFTVAFTADPVDASLLSAPNAALALSQAVPAGFIFEAETNAIAPDGFYCKIIVRDPSLKGSELQDMGGRLCVADTFGRLGPDRVEGTIFTSHEHAIGDHTVAYALQFNAPVVNRAQAKKPAIPAPARPARRQ